MTRLTLVRRFSASPEKVFDYVTVGEKLLTWWGPEGTEVVDHDLDLSQVGEYWFEQVDASKVRHRLGGEVTEINRPNNVSFTLALLTDDANRAFESFVRFQVAPHAEGGTFFKVTQKGLGSEHIKASCQRAWESTLVRLDRALR